MIYYSLAEFLDLHVLDQPADHFLIQEAIQSTFSQSTTTSIIAFRSLD